MNLRWGGSMLVLAMAALSLFGSSPEARRQASCLVTTPNGMVQGIDNGVSCSFLGIPFAAPPLGSLRWRPPQAAAPWAPVTLNATAGAVCPQINPAGSTTVQGNENCLRVNVWTPDPAPASAPVIVWMHTGAFMVGLAFAIACSANFPALLLSIVWRRFNTAGAVASIVTGAIVAVVLIVISPTVWVDILKKPAPLFWLRNPAIVSMTVAFIVGIGASLATREPRAEEQFDSEQLRTYLGVGAE